MTDTLKDKSGILIQGHIKIFDPESQKVLPEVSQSQAKMSRNRPKKIPK